jgi:hypothetical protein
MPEQKRYARDPEKHRARDKSSCEGCGCEFIKMRGTQRFHSRKCGQIARDRKRWSKRRNARLSGARLERYRSDPNCEQVGGDNFVVCRECGGLYQTLYGHMRDVHKMSLKEYHRKWPGAPWATENAKAKARQLAKRRRAVEEPAKKTERYAKLRDRQRVYRATHVEELKQWRRERRKLRRDAINRRKREQYAQQSIAELEESNRKQREKYAANREQRRAQQQGYREAHPERFKGYAQKNYAKHRTQYLKYAAKRRQVAWRPVDYKKKSPLWQVSLVVLRSAQGSLTNKQFAASLDRLGLACPYAPRFADAAARGDSCRAFVVFAQRVKKWANGQH